jgi:hypothetical protein
MRDKILGLVTATVVTAAVAGSVLAGFINMYLVSHPDPKGPREEGGKVAAARPDDGQPGEGTIPIEPGNTTFTFEEASDEWPGGIFRAGGAADIVCYVRLADGGVRMEFVLQRIRVLKEAFVKDNLGRYMWRYTLEVTPEQAETLSQAQERGALRALARPLP